MDGGDTISDYIKSSEYYLGTDDSFKDEDNAAWVMSLTGDEREQWKQSLLWTREPDRLLEGELFKQKENKNSYTFRDFAFAWRRLRSGNRKDKNLPCTSLFQSLEKRFEREGLNEEYLNRCDLYLDSLEKYVRPNLVIRDMQEYENALYGLGAFFFIFPFAPRNRVREIAALGALDQHFNILRDEFEDISRGIPYFPGDLLEEYGIVRDELPRLAVQPDQRYVRLNEHLLTDFASKLKEVASPLLSDDKLHYSWKTMLENNFRRYERIGKVMRICDYNSKQFSYRYWDYVRADLDPEIALKFRAFRSTLKI